MWKIFIIYDDKTKLTITGKQADIPLRLAIKYHNNHAAGKACKATYQQYPKKDHETMDLIQKIEELQGE